MEYEHILADLMKLAEKDSYCGQQSLSFDTKQYIFISQIVFLRRCFTTQLRTQEKNEDSEAAFPP